MNKKILLILLVLLSSLLAACSSDLTVDEAEKGLQAGFAGNRDEAEKYVCEEEVEAMGLNSRRNPDPDLAIDVSCRKDGDKLICDVRITGENLTAGGELFTITADVEDNKLCNVEVIPNN